MKVTLEMLQRELEGLGRLEVLVKAEVGHLRDQVAVLTSKVEEANRRADKLVDRLLEMALINNGHAREAVATRRVSESVPVTDDWGQPTTEEEWPPKDHIAINVP